MHDIVGIARRVAGTVLAGNDVVGGRDEGAQLFCGVPLSFERRDEDRKSTRLNSSHSQISYAVFCLKKKTASVRPSLRCGGVHAAPPPPELASHSRRST